MMFYSSFPFNFSRWGIYCPYCESAQLYQYGNRYI